MPVSADLLKALAEDPKSLEQQLGCMTGLFQIFDRQGLGRRYGSKRVSNAGSGQSQPTSACETPRHDHRGSNPYWMFEDDASRRISGDGFMGGKHGVAEHHHHRECSDSSEIFTKSFETPTESRTSPDEKSPQLDVHSPRYSEESVGGLAFYYNDPAPSSYHQASAFGISNASDAQQCQKKLKVVVPVRGNPITGDGPSTSSDIRDIVRASFDRDPQQRSRNAELTAAKPRLSVDGSHGHNHHSQGYVKILPRSSSVDGRDNNRLRVSMDHQNVVSPTLPRQPPADLPRSSSVGAGLGTARILSDWKDGLRSSNGSPRLITNKEKEVLKQNSDHQLMLRRNNPSDQHSRKLPNSDRSRDAARLTVELKEGPRLSVEGAEYRRTSSSDHSKVASPRPGSRFRDGSDQLLPSPATDNFKASLRAADIKEFLRGSSQKGATTREGHRFSVDGTRDAPRASTAPRLSVDGREYSTSQLVPRRLKMERVGVSTEPSRDQFMVRQSSCRGYSGEDGGESLRKSPNVVARLMGLEELPSSSKEAKSTSAGITRRADDPLSHEFDDLHFRGHHGSISPPPPPSPPDDYDYAHPRSSDQDVLRHWQTLQLGRIDHADHDQSILSTHTHPQLLIRPTSLKVQPSSSSRGVTSSQSGEDDSTKLLDQDVKVVDQLQGAQRKSPAQGRRSLWHIFEAMQLKGLLNGSSSKKKQAEASRLHNLKLVTDHQEKEYSEEVTAQKQRSQSLPPRLSSSNSKGIRTVGSLDYEDHGSQADPRVLALSHRDSSGYSVPEKRKPGSAGHNRQGATVSEADEESCAMMVKPIIITRSMSYKSPANVVEAPIPPTVSDNPDVDDAMSKIISRGVSKGLGPFRREEIISQMEPLQGADNSLYSHNVVTSTSSAISGLGQSARKERGAAAARNVKKASSISDVNPQMSERDTTSPRGQRSGSTHYTQQQQEKPPQARSCSPVRGDASSQASLPRYSSGTVEGVRGNLMDAGKVRRRSQAVAVKDREETKVSLANMRANATKQEFLKGRASGDPDTPRLLRRCSSESKLLTKISEKPGIASTDVTKPLSGGGRSTTPNMPLLRSKRPVISKDNRSLPLKTRPTSPLNVKSVAKSASTPKEAVTAVDSHVNRPKAGSTSASEPSSSVTAQAEQQPAAESTKPQDEVQAAAMTEVRATEGGALDRSGDATHLSNAKEKRTESKAREKSIEMIDEGVKTPRGVSIKKIDFSEDAQAEVAEQPSPVSVLDNSHFEEELTPSPKAGKSSPVCLQEQSRNEKDRRWSSARFLDLDLEDSTTSSTALLKIPELLKEETVDISEDDVPALLKDESVHRHTLSVCLKDADEERTYVEDLVEASALGSGGSSPEIVWASSCNYVMDPSVFDQVEEKRSQSLDDEAENLDRRLLFDCVNEVLERLLEAQVMTWTGQLVSPPSLRKRPMGRQLVKNVLVELEDIPCAAVSDSDVFDTVYVILQKDLVKGRGPQWPDYNTELEEIGGKVERMIFKDLIEETVRELMSAGLGAQNAPLGAGPGGASRRQLFA